MGHSQLNGACRMRRNHFGIEGAVADLLLWLLKVPDHRTQSSALASQECLRIGAVDAIPPKRVEVFVGEERRLADAFPVEEPETALK
jgi:hypothetical protein